MREKGPYPSAKPSIEIIIAFYNDCIAFCYLSSSVYDCSATKNPGRTSYEPTTHPEGDTLVPSGSGRLHRIDEVNLDVFIIHSQDFPFDETRMLPEWNGLSIDDHRKSRIMQEAGGQNFSHSFRRGKIARYVGSKRSAVACRRKELLGY